MTALYLIAQEYRESAAKLADLDLPPEVVADTLEGLSGEVEVKGQAVGYMIRTLESEAESIGQWIGAASERQTAAYNRAARLREYLSANLLACGIEKVTGPGIAISFRKSSAVVIDEPGLLPAEFMRQKPQPAPEPDKTAIKAAITSGAEVPGAHIEHRKSLQVK